MRGRAEELQALRDYVGATHPEAVDLMARSANHPDGWAGSVLALYGPPAGDELAYRGVAPSDRPPILGKTLLRYAGESQPYNGAFFRSILLRVAGEHRPGKGQEETADEQDQASGEQDNRDAALAAIS